MKRSIKLILVIILVFALATTVIACNKREEHSPAELSILLSQVALREIQGCKRVAKDGTEIFLPDAKGKYGAMWTRDFTYMAEYAGDFFSAEQLSGAFVYIANGARAEDGWIPDRVRTDGVVIYAAGSDKNPVAGDNLDNACFLTILFEIVLFKMEEPERENFYNTWVGVVERGIGALPTRDGLIFNDLDNPHSGYGFTDAVCKTGYLMTESLLYWRALGILTRLRGDYSLFMGEYLQKLADVESSFSEIFLDEDIFLAASVDCRQADYWGSAMALDFNFPLPLVVKERIASRLIADKDKIIYEGQLCHSDKPWEKMFINKRKGTYQNGAYWATATIWYVKAIYPYDAKLAEQVFLDAAKFMVNVGTYECVNKNYKKINGYVVSVTNVYGCMKFLERESSLFE